MSDQYTRITSGGSPLDTNAPVVGLLFGLSDNDNDENDKPSNNTEACIRVLDADDIPVEVSETSKLQINLHTTVFPKHKVVGWYRVVAQPDNQDLEPTEEDLRITKSLQESYASDASDFFGFCLLKVQQKVSEDEMKTEDGTSAANTLNKELPIHLYQLKEYENTPILLGVSNWQLETSPAERLSVERVLKEKPVSGGGGDLTSSSYVVETKAMQHSLVSMKDRVGVLVNYLLEIQQGKRAPDPNVLRQIQQIVSSLGPLSSLAEATSEGEEEDVELLAHLAIVARTVNTMQSYTEKFRMMNESRNSSGSGGSGMTSTLGAAAAAAMSTPPPSFF